jgi:AraC family transcriptional regulator, transcriptional activator of pobA
MTAARRLRSRPDGLPVYGYEPRPGVPPVGTVSLHDALDSSQLPPDSHAHDFFLVVYFEGEGGALHVGSRDRSVAAGDVFLVAPGDVVGIGADVSGLHAAGGTAVWFTTEALGAAKTGGVAAWQARPLLLPFAQPPAGTPKHLCVPVAERAAWSARLRAIGTELRQRRHGYVDAAVAHLTLLLVDIARLTQPAANHTRVAAEPIVAEVLAYVDAHYQDPISLRHVAQAVNLSRGHLTTVIGRKTGRTVHELITERRFAEARRLLADTSLAVDEIARHVGFRDASYFARAFRTHHGTSPLGWRRAARTGDGLDSHTRQ